MTGLSGNWLSLYSLTFLWPGKRSVRDPHAVLSSADSPKAVGLPVSWWAPPAALWTPGMVWCTCDLLNNTGMSRGFCRSPSHEDKHQHNWDDEPGNVKPLVALNLPTAGEARFPKEFKLFVEISKRAFQDSYQMPSSPWLQSDSTSENTWDTYLHL